ncbi:MAG TPA: hypothetical protein VFO30_07025 [Chthoniobacterales bacterium]|nr:hypothetical protein [Chthoniobacterales bacterium]
MLIVTGTARGEIAGELSDFARLLADCDIFLTLDGAWIFFRPEFIRLAL